MTQTHAYPMTWEESVRWLCDHPDADKRELARACYFDGSAVDAAMRFYASEEWASIRALLPSPPGRALDIGAGRGIASYALAADGWDVVAIEPDDSAYIGAGAIEEIARATDLPIAVHRIMAEEMPFESDSFDVVHCRQALHHAANLNQMVAEAIRILKPGGTFLATREHVITRHSDLPAFLARHPLQHLYGGEHAFTLEEYRTALQVPGVSKLEEITPYQNPINFFPDSAEAERNRLSRIAGVPPEDIPDFVFKIRDHYDSTPGRLYSFRVTK